MHNTYGSLEHGVCVVLTGCLLYAVAALTAPQAHADCTLTKTYSTEADFNAGSVVGELTVGPEDIQVEAPPAMLPLFNVACSGRGTMARVDINTGAVVGEYWTAPEKGRIGAYRGHSAFLAYLG